jgi:membrane-associated phospholipid phosphatase
MLFDWDKKLFFLINHGSANHFFDAVLPWARNANTWLPLYLFIIAFATINFGKKGWWWVLFAAATVALCNYISSDLIKENIWRSRPCRDEIIGSQVRFIVEYCPMSSSFTSSHAANHFGMAAFIYFSGRRVVSKWLALFFVWAIIIIYAQVYVGVHYPLDVLAGSIVGTGTGYVIASIYSKRFGLPIFDKQSLL